MSWALRFDEPWGKYCEAPLVRDISTLSTISFRYKYTCIGGRTNNELMWVARSGSVNGVNLRIGNTSSGATLSCLAGNGSRFTSTSYFDGETLDIFVTIDFDTNNMNVNVNGVEEINSTVTGIAALKGDGALSSIRFGSNYSTRYMLGDLFLAEYYEDGVQVSNWDATASDHSAGAQPILTDTKGGNNAQGFNFPTDGSAWTVGSESSILLSITETLNSFSDASSVSIVSIGYVSLAVTESLSKFSDSSGVLVVTPAEISINVTEVLSSFTDESFLTVPIVINFNPKNTIKVKRVNNTVRVKRTSNIVRVK